MTEFSFLDDTDPTTY